jgi:hypothetical protein
MSPDRTAAREAKVVRVRELFDAGLRYDDIGAIVGVSKSAVCSIAYKNHFPKRRPRRRPAPFRHPPQVALAAGVRT